MDEINKMKRCKGNVWETSRGAGVNLLTNLLEGKANKYISQNV